MEKPTARGRLIESATQLMLGKGFSSTTVDEICAHAGASKGSFYHFFESKEALGLAVLDEYYNRGLEKLGNGQHATVEDPVQRSIAFLNHLESVSEELWGHGCLMGTFALDLAETSPVIRAAVSAVFSDAVRRFAEQFEPLCDPSLGERESEELAEHFVTVLEGAIVLAKAHEDWGFVRRALQRFRQELTRTAVPV